MLRLVGFSQDSRSLRPVAQILTLPANDTEYSIALNSNYGFEFKARAAVDVRFAFAAGKVATPTEPYLTLPARWSHYQEGQFAGLTLYFAHTVGAPVTIEIVTLE